jgi:polysaccharide biosynthesis/export protein
MPEFCRNSVQPSSKDGIEPSHPRHTVSRMRILLHPCICGRLLLVLLSTASMALAQGGQLSASAAKTEPSGNADAPPPAIAPTSFKIGLGDVLHISVWLEPELTETAVVRPDGKISMPLVYEFKVVGMTPEEAQQGLTEQLNRFVHKPRVTVTVQEIHSRMVFITGEVQRPGAYPLVDAMNVVQLVARSGGLTDFAKQKKVYILRGTNNARVNVNYERVLKGLAPDQNIELSPGDTVVVP